jgi:hypothetical protein
MTPEELRAGYDGLLAEVASLRSQQAAHVCVQPYVPLTPWQTNACAAPFAGQIFTVNADEPMAFRYDFGNNTCAGAAEVPQTLILNG